MPMNRRKAASAPSPPGMQLHDGPLAASLRKFTVRAEWVRSATAVGEDAMAPGGPEGVDLTVEHLPLLAGGHPSIADPFHRLAPRSRQPWPGRVIRQLIAAGLS